MSTQKYSTAIRIKETTRSISSLELRAKKQMRHSLLIFLAIAIAFLIGCEQNRKELRLITPKSPVDRSIANDFASLLDRESEIKVVLVPTPEDSETALDALASGDGDIAIITNFMPFRADIATVMPLYPSVLHVAYHEDQPVEPGQNLIPGLRIFAGHAGSPSRFLFTQVLRRQGFTESQFTFVDAIDQLPDVVVVFSPIAPERMPELPGYALFSLGEQGEIGKGSVVDAATLFNPHFRPFVIPVGTYGPLTPEPVLTLAVDQLLVARRDLDKTLVYDLVNEIVRLKPALAALQPGLFHHISGEFDPSSSTFIIHPGAQAYTQRNAPSVYERYAGIAEVSVTIFIALFSLFFAGVRIYRMRRKNRIDAFYSKVIAVRKSIDDSLTSVERQQKADEIRLLQGTAFEQLVDEQLAADESFRIFITLSNDVLRQLGALSGDRQVSDI